MRLNQNKNFLKYITYLLRHDVDVNFNIGLKNQQGFLYILPSMSLCIILGSIHNSRLEHRQMKTKMLGALRIPDIHGAKF